MLFIGNKQYIKGGEKKSSVKIFAPPVGERSKCCGTMADRMLFNRMMVTGPPG